MKYLFVVALFVCSLSFAEAAEVTERFYPIDEGTIATTPYPGSWSNQHASIFGRLASSLDGSLDAYASTRHTARGWIAIYRSFLSFNTISIPDNAVVNSVSFVAYPKYVLNDLGDSYAYMGGVSKSSGISYRSNI